MAFPTILVDSATGSDSLASGAGPATAVNGTAASVGATATSVSITDAVDLSGVATDGTACLYYADSTAGHRNFDRITGVSGSSGAWTITVANGFSTTTGPFNWAIGGKRASLLGSISAKLIENNGGNGDAMPGWTMQLQDGHAETRSSTITCRRSGDATSGGITIRCQSGYTTRPKLTFSNNGTAFSTSLNLSFWSFFDFEMQNSNATKTASKAFGTGASTISGIRLFNIKVSDATNNFWKAFENTNTITGYVISGCEFGHTASDGIALSSNATGITIQNNWIHDCGGYGINLGNGGGSNGLVIDGNIICFNTSGGITRAGTATAALGLAIDGNVIHGNGGDGLSITCTSAQYGPYIGLVIKNNRFTFNGGYGINFSDSSMTDAALNAFATRILNNGFYGNTSGNYNVFTSASSIDPQTDDPSGGLASATKDYAGTVGGSNFMSTVDGDKGYPIGGTLAVGFGSSSYQYLDIGLQHQHTGGAGGMLYHTGGF